MFLFVMWWCNRMYCVVIGVCVSIFKCLSYFKNVFKIKIEMFCSICDIESWELLNKVI